MLYVSNSGVCVLQLQWCVCICFRETQFHPSSLVLPSKLVVMAMLVSSPSMRAHCSVLGSVPTLGAEVAPVINMYQISHFVDVDVGQHQMQLLAEPFQIMHIDLNKLRKKDLKVNTLESTGTKVDHPVPIRTESGYTQTTTGGVKQRTRYLPAHCRNLVFFNVINEKFVVLVKGVGASVSFFFFVFFL